MGWRGTLRSIGAAARAAERDAQRRHKAAVKAQIAEDAENAVEDWEGYLDDLLSIHVDLADEIDWRAMAEISQPQPPIKNKTHTEKANAKLAAYKPGAFDFLRGGSAKARAKLEAAVPIASKNDEDDHQKALTQYQADLAEWENDTTFARRLVAGDVDAVGEVLEEFQTLSSTDLIGSSIKFSISETGIHARPQVHSDEIVPNYRRQQLASGKLSETKMPIGQFNELYQDYVASVALKVAGDLFRILPHTEIFVTCETEMLDTVNGHKKSTPILSVQFVQETFMRLNLENIDPSDSMANFNHRMKFTKTKGFGPVEALKDGAE